MDIVMDKKLIATICFFNPQIETDVIALSPTAGLPPCPLWPAPRLPHQPFQQTLHQHHRFTLPYKV